MNFTKEEFDIMVEELLYRETVSFTMLCNIAEKSLRNKINFWCENDPALKGRELEGDIMQEIHLKLMKTTISQFLLKGGLATTVNYDLTGFYNWMYTVALNTKRDFSDVVRTADFKSVTIDGEKVEKELGSGLGNFENEELEGKREELREAFSVVISANARIYKILSWLAQFVFVINSGIEKKDSNGEIVEVFKDKTLFEMYGMILEMSQKISWIEITPKQHEKIFRGLNKIWKNGTVYGDATYEEFFMKDNGEISGKKSISDWVSRMNKIIQKNTNKTDDGEGI